MSRAKKAEVARLLSSKLEGLSVVSWRDDVAVNRAPDELDEVQRASDRELTLAALERNALVANQIRVALQRLEAGEYGMCLDCDQEIGARRLHAVPWASLCVTCQEHAEAEKASNNLLSD